MTDRAIRMRRPGPGAPARSRSLPARLAAPFGTLAAVAAAFVFVGVVDPNQPGRYPVCPLLRFTGILCPGCGGLRSAHAVAHGDLGTALEANAAAVAAYGAFAVFWIAWLVRSAWPSAYTASSCGRARSAGTACVGRLRLRLGMRGRVRFRTVHGWAAAGLVFAAFTVIRNLPFGAGLAP